MGSPDEPKCRMRQVGGRDQVSDDLLHKRVWKGHLTFPLEGFIAQLLNAFVSMQQCVEHVEYQLPNSHTRVSYLLDRILCSDAGLQAAMASVRTDDGPQGVRNDFESASMHLLPYDPVAKKHAASGNKRGSEQISAVGGDKPEKVAMSGAITSKTKNSIGSTGVHLRYHTPEEYDNLTIEQKDEHHAWRKNTQGNKKGTGRDGKDTKMTSAKTCHPTKKQVSAAVAKELKKLTKQEDVQPVEDDVDAHIAALVKDALSSGDDIGYQAIVLSALHH